MKLKILLYLLLTVSTLSFAQQNAFNKEVELQRFVESGGKVEEISPNNYKLTYIDGTQRVFNFNRNESPYENTIGVDTTIINMWEIDTTKYDDRFSFWQRVDIFNLNFFVPPLVGDLNRNNKPEIYGSHYLQGPVEIYERNSNGFYNSIYAYTNSGTFAIQAMGEINGIGEKEVYLVHNNFNNGVIYRSDSTGVLPTTFDFTFYYGNQFSITDMTFGDWDKNGIADCAFISADSLGVPLIIIAEFRDSLNNFTTVYEKITADTDWVNVPSGFAIGDFDNDSKTELVAGTTQGIIYSFEATSENLYELIWQSNFSTSNAYMNTATNDIDGNGNPEFWIGGQNFVEGTTRFNCYEDDGDNNYKTVAVIELRYVNSLYTNYLQAKDIDEDGKEELIISLANVILILKFNGTVNQHHYEIYYTKIGEATQPEAEFEPLSLANLDEDNKTDLLLPLIGTGPSPLFSYILKNNGISGIEQSDTNKVFSEDYIKSYPVPFNGSSSIKFFISKESSVKLEVYNSLGKEITILLDDKLSPGEYSIKWKAEDKYSIPLPSGIYFITLQTEYITKTTKTILLK